VSKFPGKPNAVASQRLVNQGLVKPALTTARDVVAMLGAVQSQDYGGAKWALAQRTTGLTDSEIEKEIDDAAIVRTHVLRPTWHFVAAEDIGWMLALTAPRVHAANAYWYRWLEVDDAVARLTRTVVTKALRDGEHLTRAELATRLAEARLDVSNPIRLAGIVMRAELDGLICSGRRRGKQFTYALLEERVKKSATLERDAALFELARRYFTTRGPATVDDFAWWSGLTKADAKRGVEAAASHLKHESIDGRLYWSPTSPTAVRFSAPIAHLLPNYDEHFVGHKDRSAFGTRLQSLGVKPRTSALSGHALVVNGQIVGGWRRSLAKGKVTVEPTPLIRLPETERRAIRAAVQKFGEFLALKAEIRWS
jgi:hypothetical protein